MKVESLEKHTEESICEILDRKYSQLCKYKIPNVFVFASDWESDFFMQNNSGYAYEFEIKVSRSDFLNDKKKVKKHSILSTGKFTHTTQTYDRFDKESNKTIWIESHEEREHNFRPNKFYYVVPEGLVAVDEVPSYAGLMYIKDFFAEEIKPAPFIHKEKLSFESILCNKFYYAWLESKREVLKLKRDN
mgnify:FL=1